MIRSSWTIDSLGVRPLGAEPLRPTGCHRLTAKQDALRRQRARNEAARRLGIHDIDNLIFHFVRALQSEAEQLFKEHK